MQNTHWKITEPCPVPVEQMDVTAKGHYCHSCEKEVFNLDHVRPDEIGYKAGDQLCGRITLAQPKAEIWAMSKWSSFLVKWMGVSALFFIPLKKGKTQTVEAGQKSGSGQEKKTLANTKRFIGTVRGADNKPVRTKVVVTDSTGKTVAETQSIANGRYLVEVDTPSVKGDQIQITAVDTPYIIKLDTNWVFNYPLDSIFIGNVITTSGGVSTQITLGWTVPTIVTSATFMMPPMDADDTLLESAKGGVEGLV